ncbi:Flavin-binding monooxygenase [Aspergillus sclerotialis]|uniref:Flavin-binding monooxygenase n=1 Tax=Aspergillus sclerotialis TaxID=2070753 RepID=A0A3A2ZF35_9EURO|nr:Flavin-binding monooxygenase [Aspergillus sclerotialis]
MPGILIPVIGISLTAAVAILIACCAAQVVPAIVKYAGFVKQYARSGQWFHARPNHVYTELEKFLFKWMPLKQRLLRLRVFFSADEETTTYFPTPKGQKARLAVEEESKRYIKSITPKKYWNNIIPTFPLGCKRRIFDPDYLDYLNRPNVELLPEGIQEMTETGIITSSGISDDFDIIVLATSSQVSQFLTPIQIFGSNGQSLQKQWNECRGDKLI